MQARIHAATPPLILSMALLLPSVSSAHSGHNTQLAWQVCESASRGTVCEYTKGSNRYSGSCQAIATALMCVRNKPLEPLDIGSTSNDQ